MTSNLIALWSLKQKEVEAMETLRHNKEMEAATKRRELIDEKIANMNYEISKFNAITNRYAAERNSHIALLNYAVSTMQAETARKRIESDEKINALKLEQAERERVTDSYLSQKRMNMEDRNKQKEFQLREAELKQDRDIATFRGGIDIAKMITGGLAFNYGRKVSKPAWIH